MHMDEFNEMGNMNQALGCSTYDFYDFTEHRQSSKTLNLGKPLEFLRYSER